MSDQIVSLARRLAAAHRRHDALERTRIAANEGMWGNREFEMHADDEAFATRDMITLTPATSLAGAAIQIGEALSRLDCIESCFPQDSMTFQTDQDFRAMLRLLFSAFAAIDTMLDEKVGAIAPDIFADDSLNPWLAADQVAKAA